MLQESENTALSFWVKSWLQYSHILEAFWVHVNRYLIDKTESVQRFFNRKLHGLSNLSYLDRLHVLGLETLKHRRLIHDLILCYKYLHGLIDTDNRNFWCVQMSPRTRNNCLKLYKGHCNTDVRKAFFYQSRCWHLELSTCSSRF